MPDDIPVHIDSLHSAYGNGAEAKQIMNQCLQRLQRIADPGIFIALCSEAQIDQQLAALGPFDPELKPLWGIPYAVKDNIDVKGLPTTAACPAYSYLPETDAFAVALLRKAGAICLGKTNMDQFATGLTGTRTPHAIPRNVIDDKLIPGGSSSGSAIAVAHGIVAFALGTDTAGSGRVPAALNNIVGIKPSLGAVSNRGVIPACRSLDSVSVFALSVIDGNRVRALLSHYDQSDPFARRFDQLSKQGNPDKTRIYRLAVPSEETIQFYSDDEQAEAFSRALSTMGNLETEIVGIDFSAFYQAAELLYEGAWLAERFVAVGDFIEQQPEQIHPTTHAIISKAKQHKATDAFKDLYRLQALKRQTELLLEGFDAICVPSVPRLFTLQELEHNPIVPNSKLGTYTNFANLLDFCGISLPTHARSDGLPASITLLARAGQDTSLAALAWQLQLSFNTVPGASGFSLTEIPASSLKMPTAADSFIELAVCGAHMQGLPLNDQLTDLGGEFVRSDRTSENYRFYKLAGGPPFRPGLICCPGHGDSIELEIWRLPQHRFAEFISKVPAPLGIGTVTLNNGEQVKSFICEGYAAQTAEDITHHRSWRKFLALR